MVSELLSKIFVKAENISSAFFCWRKSVQSLFSTREFSISLLYFLWQKVAYLFVLQKLSNFELKIESVAFWSFLTSVSETKV